MDVTTILFIRFSIAAVCMLIWLKLRGEALPRGTLLIRLVVMGAIGYVGQSLCYMSALQYASAGLVALLLYLYPMLVTILSVLILKDKLTKWNGLALLLATAGAALTANPQGGQWMGVLLAIIAAIVYAGYIIVGTGVMAQVSAVQSSAVIFSSAAFVFGLLSLLSGFHLPVDSSGWWVMGGMGIIATLVPVSAFLAGLKRVGPRDASLLSTFEPAVTVALAALILGEPVRMDMLLGGGLILAAVILTVSKQKQRTASQPKPEIEPVAR
jgi:drug/metabolite transporter (DMT)-like permease